MEKKQSFLSLLVYSVFFFKRPCNFFLTIYYMSLQSQVDDASYSMLHSSHAAKSRQILCEKTPQPLKLKRSVLKIFYPFVQILDQDIRAEYRCCKFSGEKGVNKKNVILRCLSSGRRQKKIPTSQTDTKCCLFFLLRKFECLALVSKG